MKELNCQVSRIAYDTKSMLILCTSIAFSNPNHFTNYIIHLLSLVNILYHYINDIICVNYIFFGKILEEHIILILRLKDQHTKYQSLMIQSRE